MLRHLTRFLSLLLIFAMLVLPLPATASSDDKPFARWFDEEAPYETVPVLSEQLVVAAGKEPFGFVGTRPTQDTRNHKLSEYEHLEGILSLYSQHFDQDYKWEELPSLKEQFAQYDEAFFQDHALIVLYSLGNFGMKNGAYLPDYQPSFQGIYLQNDLIFIDTTGGSPAEGVEQVGGKFLGYFRFLTLEKSAYQEMISDKPSYFLSLRSAYEDFDAPNTADPVLSFTALAVASTALLAAGVCTRRQRRRVK